jgi:hypothetical protein
MDRFILLFKQGSTNLNIRNGVGILLNNKIIFAMSRKEINFYDFATYFKSMGCKNALYLDGLFHGHISLLKTGHRRMETLGNHRCDNNPKRKRQQWHRTLAVIFKALSTSVFRPNPGAGNMAEHE